MALSSSGKAVPMARRLDFDQPPTETKDNLESRHLMQALLERRRDDGASWEDIWDDVVAVVPTEGAAVLDAAASLASRHQALREYGPRLRYWLALLTLRTDVVRVLGGEPRRVIDEAAQTIMAQASIQGEAIRAIWSEPMLEPKDAAVALGAKATNREKVRRLREGSHLLGLPSGARFLYPAFQFDALRREVFPYVRAVNERLGAADDPWGVASWWVSRNARVDARPVDLVETGRADDLVLLAGAVTGPVG